VPTSVLLAVLATAGLLAFAPALVRRYDATERLVAERALSTARVLARAGAQRPRRRRTVPGRRPVNPPGWMASSRIRPVAGSPGAGSSVSGSSVSGSSVSGAPVSGVPAAARVTSAKTAALRPVSALPESGRAAARRRHTQLSRAVYRRRRVLLALVLLNIAELVGVAFVGPGFWIGAAFSGALLGTYLVHLRNRSLTEARRRREEARYAAWVASRQAAVRRAQARRAAERREAVLTQLAERDQARREAARIAALRGRPYEWRAVGQ
jgi:hypothetical protein